MLRKIIKSLKNDKNFRRCLNEITEIYSQKGSKGVEEKMQSIIPFQRESLIEIVTGTFIYYLITEIRQATKKKDAKKARRAERVNKRK